MAGAEIESAEYVLSEHQEEMEVLQSIFDGDENFKVVNSTTIQYKIGEDEEPLSIIVEIRWNANYPQYIPTFNLDCFYNQHLPPAAKKEAMAALMEEAKKNEGDQQTYALIEWMKENILQLIGPYVFDEMCRLESRDNEDDPENPAKEEDQEKSKESRKEQMTKAQKRREWNRKGKDGKVERGHDWVDVVRHLSQTGGGTPLTGAEDSPATPKPVVEAAAIPPNPN